MDDRRNEPAEPERRVGQDRPQPVSASHREETQPCPRCGYPMPALKGGSTSICPNCGFKDSCCY
jgi:hypothetical protein